MTPQERASQIVDKYWKVEPERFPNPYLLEADIAQAITTERQRQERLVEKVRDVWKIQMNDPSSKEDSYMRGMANGLELAMSILEDMRQPNYIEKPNKS